MVARDPNPLLQPPSIFLFISLTCRSASRFSRSAARRRTRATRAAMARSSAGVSGRRPSEARREGLWMGEVRVRVMVSERETAHARLVPPLLFTSPPLAPLFSPAPALFWGAPGPGGRPSRAAGVRPRAAAQRAARSDSAQGRSGCVRRRLAACRGTRSPLSSTPHSPRAVRLGRQTGRDLGIGRQELVCQRGPGRRRRRH